MRSTFCIIALLGAIALTGCVSFQAPERISHGEFMQDIKAKSGAFQEAKRRWKEYEQERKLQRDDDPKSCQGSIGHCNKKW